MVGFPPSAGWEEHSLLTNVTGMRNERTALVPEHSTNYSALCKTSFKKACCQALRDGEASSSVYKGRMLKCEEVVRQRSCPPIQAPRSISASPPSHRDGAQVRPLRCISWNAGHLGNQQWTEIRDWLSSEAALVCDVFILQETHWTASAQFTVDGWTCISSATTSQKTVASKVRNGKQKGGIAQKSSTADNPCAKDPSAATSCKSFAKVDGVMVLLSHRIAANQVRWRDHIVGRLIEIRFTLESSHFVLMAVYQHVWSSAKRSHQNRKDRASLLASLSKATRQIPSRTSPVVAGENNALKSPSFRLVGPRTCPQPPSPRQ